LEAAVSACLTRLEASLGEGGPGPDELSADLSAFPLQSLDAALRRFAQSRRAEALPLLTTLAEQAPRKELRKAARRALYRLAQSGIEPPPGAPRAMVERQPDHPARAWVSGIDGGGSRAVWILFEGGYGQLSLCSVILNDQTGIVEAGGGGISKRRLETELRALREQQKFPWVEAPVDLAVRLVAESLSLGPAPPEFARWRRYFSAVADHPEPGAFQQEMERLGEEARGDPTLVDHSAELLDLPELAGWFLHPDSVQSDAVSLLEARGSRIVVSDQIKAEREAWIVDRVIDREFGSQARARWAHRLQEMAWIFRVTERPREAKLAYAAAVALQDPERPPRHLPFVRTLVQRGLELAARVALGQLSAKEVPRTPGGGS